MEISYRTWTAAVRLGVVVSVLAASLACVVALLGNVPEAAVVLPVIVVAFTTSWIQTERIRRQVLAERLVVGASIPA